MDLDKLYNEESAPMISEEHRNNGDSGDNRQQINYVNNLRGPNKDGLNLHANSAIVQPNDWNEKFQDSLNFRTIQKTEKEGR